MTQINDIQVQGENFIDSLSTIVDSVFEGQNQTRIITDFKEAYLDMVSREGAPWVPILSEYVHMAEVAELTSSFVNQYGENFRPEEIEPADYQLITSIAGLMHDTVWVLRTEDSPTDFSGLSLKEKLTSLRGVEGSDETSSQIAENILSEVAPEYAEFVGNLVRYHGSGLRKREGGAEGIEYVLPICFADGTDRNRDRNTTLALGTQVLNYVGRALKMIENGEDPQKIIEYLNTGHKEFVDTYKGNVNKGLIHQLGPGYKRLPVEMLTPDAENFLIRTANTPYTGTPEVVQASQNILKTTYDAVNGDNGIFAQVNALFKNILGTSDMDLVSQLPTEMWKRNQTNPVPDQYK